MLRQSQASGGGCSVPIEAPTKHLRRPGRWRAKEKARRSTRGWTAYSYVVTAGLGRVWGLFKYPFSLVWVVQGDFKMGRPFSFVFCFPIRGDGRTQMMMIHWTVAKCLRDLTPGALYFVKGQQGDGRIG